MKKNILIIGGIRQAHQYFYENEYNVIWFSTQDNSFLNDATAGARLLFNFDIQEGVDTYIHFAKSVHERFPLSAICGFHDHTQHIAIAVSEALNVYCALDMNAVKNCRDKGVMRELLFQQHPNITYWVVDNREQLESVIAKISQEDMPLIVKPLAGVGSRGVEKVGDMSALKLNLTQNSEYPLIIESFIEGQEYSVEAFSESGVHRVLAITQKTIEPDSFVEVAHHQPAILNEEQSRKIQEYTVGCLGKLGIKNGASHTEIIFSSKLSEPFIVESHTRPCGDFVPEMIKYTEGIDIFSLMARQALGELVLHEIPEDLPQKRSHIGIAFFYSHVAGYVQEIAGVEEMKREAGLDSNIIEFKLDVKVGDAINKMACSADRVGHVIYEAECPALLRENLKRLQELIEIETAPI